MSPELVVLLVGVFAATSCALIGVFLVLRKMAMMADAISHAILPGLVAGYFLAEGPNLWAGFVGAAAAGILTVSLVELLNRSGRVKEDAAIGLVFPALFALGTLMVSKFFGNVHLDTDAVLYGEIAFAPFDRLIIGRYEYGPLSLWVLGGLCLVNLLFIVALYKELKLATFDGALAATLGFSPVLIHYLLMSLVSLTTVGAFTAVGAILVVALLIVPPATAYLLTDRLPVMIILAVAAGILAAVGGYALAIAINASISGAMATVAGVLFGLALLLSPSHGLVAKMWRHRQQRQQFAAEMLIVHLFNHAGGAEQAAESTAGHLESELLWTSTFADTAIRQAVRTGLVRREGDDLRLTARGQQQAQSVIIR
jgi:manganese/zinc/iron transport system permease protein